MGGRSRAVGEDGHPGIDPVPEVTDPQDPRGARDHRVAHRLLRRIASEGGGWLVVLAATSLTMAAAELALPAVLGGAVDAVVADRAPGAWLLACAGLVIVLVAADAIDDLAAGAAVARSTAWLRTHVFEHLLRAGVGRQRPDPGEVSTRLVGNAAEAGRVAPDAVRALAGIVPAVGGAVALALIHPWLCLTFLAGLPAFALMVRAFARDASSVAARYLDAQGAIAGRLVGAVAGARTIAAAGTVEVEVERVLQPLPELRHSGDGMWRAQMRITAQDAVVLALLELAVLCVGGALLADGRLSAGQLLAAAQYVVLAATIGSGVNAVVRLTRSRAAAHRLLDVLERPAVVHGSEPLAPGAGRLEFAGVSVFDRGRPLIHDLDLEIPAGMLVSIVGRSGSGKSLLAGLAGRLADPDLGEVRLDGTPLADVGRAPLRHAVAYGFERPALLGRDVAGAIAFADEPPPDTRVVAAARAARADDAIRAMPDGYRTPLDRAPMSGGEVQRVGLARAFARDARVLVLDDVAASLDTVTEHHITTVLTEELSDRTRLVVTHRASTAARADRVVWLEAGRVRAIGRHHELWQDPGYRALFEAGA
jgi:ATP-binding cassette subfamily B protein